MNPARTKTARALREISVLVGAVLVFSALSAAADTHPEHVPGEVLIKLKHGSAISPKTPLSSSSSPLVGHDKVNRMLGKRASAISPIFEDHGNKNAASQEMTRPRGLHLWQKVEIKDLREDPEAVCKELLATGELESCQPNYIHIADSVPALPKDTYLYPNGTTPSTTFMGQAYPDMWGLINMRTVEAWNSQGPDCDNCMGEGVLVAVVDTGVDYNHNDIAANVPSHGWNFDIDPRHNRDNAMDYEGHGTHVAGTIAASQNQIGIAGIAPRAQVLPIRSMWGISGGRVVGTDGSLSNGIKYAVDIAEELTSGAVIINNSWEPTIGGNAGISPQKTVVGEAIMHAIAHDVPVIFAAGNTGYEIEPSDRSAVNFPGVISVAALTPSGSEIGCWSSYGPNVTIAAPGSQILSLRRGSSSYTVKEGSSQAAPHVTGVVALLKARDERLTPAEIKQILMRSADQDLVTPNCVEGSVTKPHAIGGGKLNALKAVELVGTISKVVGRYIFYKNSFYDGTQSRPDLCGKACGKNTAIASDKSPLLMLPDESHRASFSNYTSYTKGINGIMIDVRNLPNGQLSASDFEFKINVDRDGTQWTDPQTPPDAIEVARGEGVDGSSRIAVTWPDNSIVNRWLRVTLKATPNTGLAENDVFYFGNALGDSGDGSGGYDILVDSVDWNDPMAHWRTPLNRAEITNQWDYNRDSLVNAMDAVWARRNATKLDTSVKLILIPSKQDYLVSHIE